MHFKSWFGRIFRSRPWRVQIQEHVLILYLDKNDGLVLFTTHVGWPERILWPSDQAVIAWVIWRRGRKQWWHTRWGDSRSELYKR